MRDVLQQRVLPQRRSCFQIVTLSSCQPCFGTRHGLIHTSIADRTTSSEKRSVTISDTFRHTSSKAWMLYQWYQYRVSESFSPPQIHHTIQFSHSQIHFPFPPAKHLNTSHFFFLSLPTLFLSFFDFIFPKSHHSLFFLLYSNITTHLHHQP